MTLIYTHSPPPPPAIQTPRKDFIYLKHSKNPRLLTFIEPMTTSLWPPCKRTQHCWTNNDGSCCVRLPVAYGTVF